MMAMMNFIHAPFAAFSPGDPPAEGSRKQRAKCAERWNQGNLFATAKNYGGSRSNLGRIRRGA
jgi:hypothetical protein